MGFIGLMAIGFLCVLLAIPWSLLSLFGNPESELNLFLDTEYTVPLLILHLWLYGVMAVWSFAQIRQSQIKLLHLLGHFSDLKRELRLLLLLIPVLMFSLGVAQLSWLALGPMLPKNIDPLWLANPLLLLANTSLALPHKVLLVSLVVLVEPAIEELFFRGLVLQRLATKWNWSVGISISSLMFAILHANVVGFLVFGIVLALVYQRTRLLWLPWLLHSAHHAIALWTGQLSSMALFPFPRADFLQWSSSWRIDLLYASFAAPWLVVYIYQNWPRRDRKVCQF